MSYQGQHSRRLVPIEQAQAILGNIGRTKLYELIGAGELRAVKLGRRTLLVEEEVIAYADALPSIAIKSAAGGRTARRPRS